MKNRQRHDLIIRNNFNKLCALPALYIRLADEDGLETAVSDFISCMTDEYAIDLFKELCIPKQWIRI